MAMRDTKGGLMQGKVCLVTGGNAGLGKATAKRLAGLGAKVVILCRDKARGEAALAEIHAATGNRLTELLVADLAEPASLVQAAAQFKKSYSRLDVLINNAGIYAKERRLNSLG